MSFLEIFALVTGAIFLVLQILHHKWMWPVEIVSCLALLAIYVPDKLWGSAALQVYYIVMAVIGMFKWSQDSKEASAEGNAIIMNKPDSKVIFGSFAIIVAGGFVCSLILKAMDDPAPRIDGIVTILGIVATWWLTKSNLEQWLMWILADSILIVLCLSQKLYGPMMLYCFYTVSSIVGYFNWRKNGVYK